VATTSTRAPTESPDLRNASMYASSSGTCGAWGQKKGLPSMTSASNPAGTTSPSWATQRRPTRPRRWDSHFLAMVPAATGIVPAAPRTVVLVQLGQPVANHLAVVMAQPLPGEGARCLPELRHARRGPADAPPGADAELQPECIIGMACPERYGETFVITAAPV